MKVMKILSSSLKMLTGKTVGMNHTLLPDMLKTAQYSTSPVLSKAMPATASMNLVETSSTLPPHLTEYLKIDSTKRPADALLVSNSIVRVDSLITELNSILTKKDLDWNKVEALMAIIGSGNLIPESTHSKLLSRALENTDEEAIKIIGNLVDRYNININAKDKAGCTVLYEASDVSTPEVVNWLLSNGASPDVVCFGDTPYRIAAARAKGDDEDGLSILKLLFKSHVPEDKVLNDVCAFLQNGSTYVESEGRNLVGAELWDKIVGELDVS